MASRRGSGVYGFGGDFGGFDDPTTPPRDYDEEIAELGGLSHLSPPEDREPRSGSVYGFGGDENDLDDVFGNETGAFGFDKTPPKFTTQATPTAQRTHAENLRLSAQSSSSSSFVAANMLVRPIAVQESALQKSQRLAAERAAAQQKKRQGEAEAQKLKDVQARQSLHQAAPQVNILEPTSPHFADFDGRRESGFEYSSSQGDTSASAPLDYGASTWAGGPRNSALDSSNSSMAPVPAAQKKTSMYEGFGAPQPASPQRPSKPVAAKAAPMSPSKQTYAERAAAARLKRHAEEQREQQERERRLSEFNPSSKVVRETPQSSTSAFATRAPANFDLLANTMDRIRGGGAPTRASSFHGSTGASAVREGKPSSTAGPARVGGTASPTRPKSSQFLSPGGVSTNSSIFASPGGGDTPGDDELEDLDPAAIEAAEWTNTQIRKLIDMIKQYGAEDVTTRVWTITFGTLFEETAQVFDALSGICKTAKKYQVVAYDAEQLWQGKDDYTVITLLQDTFQGVKVRRRKKSALAKAASSSSIGFGRESQMHQNQKCHACGKTVYALEFVGASDKAFHKACFRCVKCNKALGQNDYSVAHDRQFRCNAHHREFELAGL